MSKREVEEISIVLAAGQWADYVCRVAVLEVSSASDPQETDDVALRGKYGSLFAQRIVCLETVAHFRMQPHSGILTPVIDFIDWLLLQDANERSERESENEPQRKNK